MEQGLILLNARLLRCQQLQALSSTREEKEGWVAEEAGLRDAVFGTERTDLIRVSYPSQVERYQLGFEEGLALLSSRSGKTTWREISEGVRHSCSSH